MEETQHNAPILSDVLVQLFFPFLLPAKTYQQFLNSSKESQLWLIRWNMVFRIVALSACVVAFTSIIRKVILHDTPWAYPVVLTAGFLIVVLFWYLWVAHYLNKNASSACAQSRQNHRISLFEVLVELVLPLTWPLEKRRLFRDAPRPELLKLISLHVAVHALNVAVVLTFFGTLAFPTNEFSYMYLPELLFGIGFSLYLLLSLIGVRLAIEVRTLLHKFQNAARHTTNLPDGRSGVDYE